MDALPGSGKCLTSESLLGVRAWGLFEMLSSLHCAEMDDDGKNSQTDLVGGELRVPQNTSVWFDHSTVFLALEVATGICHRAVSARSPKKICSHVDTVARKLNNHPQASGLHCRAWWVSAAWAGQALLAGLLSIQTGLLALLLSWPWFMWRPRPALLCLIPSCGEACWGCSRLCLLWHFFSVGFNF